MSCKNCRIRVENSLNETEGVWAAVNLKKKEATVRMKSRISEQELRRAVEKAGYDVRNITWQDD